MEVWGTVERTVAICFFGSARCVSSISLPWLQKILDLAKAFVFKKKMLRNYHISTDKGLCRRTGIMCYSCGAILTSMALHREAFWIRYLQARQQSPTWVGPNCNI